MLPEKHHAAQLSKKRSELGGSASAGRGLAAGQPVNRWVQGLTLSLCLAF